MKPYLVQSFHSIEGTGRAGIAYEAIKVLLAERGVGIVPAHENTTGEEKRILYPEEGFGRDLDEVLGGFVAAVVLATRPPHRFSWARLPEVEWNEDGYRIRAKVLT